MSSQWNTDDPVRRLVIAPNGSLSVAQAQWFFIGVAVVSVTIAGFVTAWGLWLIWPFTGLELLALGAALYVSMRDNGYREIVSVYHDRIEIEAGIDQPQRRWEFPRLLTQVRLLTGPHRHSPTRLLVTRHGRGCEIGGCLRDDERARVAERLKLWVTTVELPEAVGCGTGEMSYREQV